MDVRCFLAKQQPLSAPMMFVLYTMPDDADIHHLCEQALTRYLIEAFNFFCSPLVVIRQIQNIFGGATQKKAIS